MDAPVVRFIEIQGSGRADFKTDSAGDALILGNDRLKPHCSFNRPDCVPVLIFNSLEWAYPATGTAVDTNGGINDMQDFPFP
jgi:hypothetical protein